MPFIQLQFRRGTATQWTSANPVLADGELAIESDTSKFKIGNGFGSWNFLPYGGLVGPTGTIGNTVSIDISFNGNIFVGRDVSFGGNLAVRNDVSFNKELRVGGNINIRSGAASISSGTGALIVAGGVGVGGNLNVALDASFNNRLFVNKDVSFGAKLCVQSDVSFNGNTSVALLPFYTGNATITPATNQLVTKKYVDENGGTILLGANNVWTANNTFNGNTSVAILPVYTGNASVTPATNQLVTKKYVDENGGTILLSGNNTWTANNTFNGSRFYVNADASFQNKLTVGDDVSLNTRLFVGQDSSLNGNVFVRRNLVVGGDASFNDNMSVQSDSSFNNRLYVGRQIGVGVTANASYALDVLGNINLSGNLYLNDKLFSITSADISLNANLMVGADASFNGNVFMSKTLNLRKTVITGAATGSPTSIVATTAIVEITGSGASTAYFNLLGGSYAGQTLTIISATNGGGGGLFVNAVASNIIFNGSVCSQMRFSNAFQTVYLVWSSDVSDWIVTSWQGVNFGGVSMNFGTYTSGDITLGAAGRVNINPSVGGMVVGSDSSLNGNLSVGGTDSSFNGNLYTGGYINAEGFIERFVNVASSSGTYTADFNNGIIIYVNSFSGSSTPTLSITNLPTVLNQSYVFTVVYSGLPTSTYFSALNINGASVPVSGSVSLTAASSYYVHQFCIFFTDATNLGNNFVVQNFNSSAPLSLVSPLVSGNLSVNGNINLTGGNIFQNGVLFSGGGGGGVGTSGNSLSLSGNLYVGGDVSFNNRLTGNGDVSLNQRLFVGLDASINANVNVGGNINFRGNLFQNGVLFTGGGGVGTSGNSLSLSGNLFVGGDVSFNGRLTGNGDVSLNQRLFVGSDVSFGGNLVVRRTTASTSSTTGALIVAGGIGVGGNVEVGGLIEIANTTASTSAITGALTVAGGVGVNGNVRVGSSTASSSVGTGALTVAGGVGVTGAVFAGSLNATGVINTTLATASTSVGTGALILNGSNAGIGVAGNIYAGGNLYVTGSIVSPTLAGTPLAPTAAGGGAGTTQIATTAYVRGEINTLIGGAPGALDTLNELATALGNNASFSTAVTNSIALKANIASPIFTGTVGGITKSMVGLTNVDDTSDANKPVSTLQQTELNLKLNLSEPSIDYYITNSGSGSYLVNGVSNGNIYLEKGKKYKIHVNASGHPFWIQIVSGAYSSSNLYNTGITNNGTQSGYINIELSSTAPQLYYACQYHSAMAGSIITGTTFETYKSLSNISNVDNTSDANKPVSSATTTQLNLKAPIANPTFTGTVNAPAVSVTNSTASSGTGSGALIVTGGVGVGGAVFAGSFNTAGVITTTNTTASANSTTGALIVAGGAGVSGNVNVGGNVNFTGNLFQNGVLFTSGSSGPNLTLAGNLVVNGTTQSTSKTTGAVIVAGGVGVGGNVEVGGNIQLTGIFKSNNNTDNKKIALYEEANIGVASATDFYGFGVNAGVLRYQTIGGGSNRHHFYSGIADGIIAGGKLVLNGTSALNMTGPPDPQPVYQYDTNFPLLITSPKAPVAPGTTTYAMGLGVDFATGYGFISCAGNSQVQPLMIQPRANGNVGIGITTNPTTLLQVGGAVTAVSFNATSDYRIKHNVHSLCDDASFNVDVLKPVSFVNTQLGKPDIGFIAHEVQEYYPYLVNGVKDGESMQTLNYTGIIGILTKEIQELKKKVSYQETKTIEQEQRIQDLEKMVLDILANK